MLKFVPAVGGRAACNFIELKNAGATCHMNSVIQQLYLIPGIKESNLAIDDEDSDEDTLFFQFQMVMGLLQDSKLQYYVPESNLSKPVRITIPIGSYYNPM